MDANNNQKTRLSIEEFLSMNDKWLERQAYVKKKKTKRMTVLSIWTVLVMIGGPALLIPMLSDYLGFASTMIIYIVVIMALLIIAAIRATSQEHADENESEKIKRELYSQYLKENGFI
jgi:hypothetical protein